ncbi:MAG: DEAD/DEAH box helicase [Planctomycetales bacterium]|nr:DEAD/DEAH box helicase [Planctomycetales bacterium]
MQIIFNPRKIESYRNFLKVKQLPAWSMRGRLATFPDIYASRLGIAVNHTSVASYDPEPWLFDYQAAITRTAIERQKFAVFADCGLGKTLIMLSYAAYVRQRIGKRRILIITPPLVVRQIEEEARRFYGDSLPIEVVKANGLAQWISSDGEKIGITNYEALKKDTPQGKLGALILDESSILKSHYGNYAGICLKLGEGLEWKLCCTGTPAPNDRIEYANHACFLDRFPTVNSFLAKYFVNRGQTGERWELKPHALRPFYRSLSDWCIFLTDPSVYGWQDNCSTIPPINVHIEEVPLTAEQRAWVQREHGTLVAIRTGGITQRSAFGQVSKGYWKGQEFDTNKYQFIADLVNSWRDEESTLCWCLYDNEQQRCQDALGGDSMTGKTPWKQREEMIQRFKLGESRVLTSKSRILGFGLNLQAATRQVFSGLQDSYEAYYQCVKRSNRIGSTKPLNVHIPVTELEEPMVENVLRKAKRVEHDTKEQEQLFKELSQ